MSETISINFGMDKIVCGGCGIVYINATPAMDEVRLPDGFEIVQLDSGDIALNYDGNYGEWTTISYEGTAFHQFLQALLKSTTAPQMYVRHKGTPDECTSPDTRVMADRRKSAEGDWFEAPDHHGRRCGDLRYGRRSNDRARWTAAPNTKEAPKVYKRKDGNAFYYSDDTRVMADRRINALGYFANEDTTRKSYGRRPGDRARWTGEAAPVVGDKPELVPGIRKAIQWFEENPTQPAQEAPQPEKPGLVEAFSRDLYKIMTHAQESDADASVTRAEFAWLLRELDARQGEK